jgi:hypothetical protein
MIRGTWPRRTWILLRKPNIIIRSPGTSSRVRAPSLVRRLPLTLAGAKGGASPHDDIAHGHRLGKRVAQLSSALTNEVRAALRFSLGCDAN